MRAASNCSHSCGRPGDRAGAQQRLVLPGPRFLEFVLAKCRERLHQQTAIAGGPQPRVDFVQAARRAVHREQVHEALAEPLEEQSVVDRLRAIGALRLAARVVQEHQVQVRAVAELQAAELAVRDHDHVRDARRAARVGVTRHAVPRLDLRPRQHQRFLHDQLGDVGETIADLHQRQAADQIGDRDPEQGRALELAQQLDLPLRLLVLHVLARAAPVLPRTARASALPRSGARRSARRAAAAARRSGRRGTGSARTARPACAAPPRSRSAVRDRRCGRRSARGSSARAPASRRATRTARCSGSSRAEQLVQSASPGFVQPAVIGSVAQLIQRR